MFKLKMKSEPTPLIKLPVSIPIGKIFEPNLVSVIEFALVIGIGFESGIFTAILMLWILFIIKAIGMSVAFHEHKVQSNK